jgi:hypothetical protein
MGIEEHEYANSIQGIAERIAFQLGDDDPLDPYSQYPLKWITARLFDTFKWLQGRRPSLFGHVTEVSLTWDGMAYTLPPECERLLEVLSVSVDGKPLPVFESDYASLKASFLYNSLINDCSGSGLYHYAMLPGDSQRLLLTPLVNVGKEVHLMINCSNMKRFFDDPTKELDCEVLKWVNTVIEYVMYQAQSMDTVNGVTQTTADRHRSSFFDLAPVARRQEQTS